MKLLQHVFSAFTSKENPSRAHDVRILPGKGTQEFTNKTDRPLEVYVEMYSDLYILQPDDVMTVIYDDDLTAPNRGLSTQVYGDSLVIYPTTSITASVLINGKPVEPWDQSAANQPGA